MSISTRPVGTSNRALSDGTSEPDPTRPSRPSKSALPVVVRAFSAMTCGADTPRDRGSQVITIRARPSVSRTMPTHVSMALLRRSARRDSVGMVVAEEASIARHSLPSGDQYPGRVCTTTSRRLARTSTA
jgi:hypothetical protein